MKVALVTGASGGIGREFARIHAERGGDLVIVARSAAKLEDLKKEIEAAHGVAVKVIVKDLTGQNAASELYTEVKESGIEIDYLINNAGFGFLGVFHELPWEKQREMMQLNMIALSELMHLFLPDFVSRNSGHILNVSSTASLMPGPLQAVYFATKAYVASLTNAISEELSDTAVKVTNLMPGATETGFEVTAGMEKTPLFKKTTSASVVAKAGYDAMLKGKLDIISGLTFSQKILTALIPLTPKKIILKQVKQLQQSE